MKSRLILTVAMLGGLCATTSCSKSTEVLVPTSMVVGANLTFTSLSQARQLTAAVLDQHGDTLLPSPAFLWSSGNTAVLAVTQGGLAQSISNGTATVTVTAPADGLSKGVTVTVAQAPSTISKTGGDAQNGLVSATLAQPLIVHVVDVGGSPIPGATVNFAVTAGAGNVSVASVAADASGNASTSWTLGAGAGSQQVTASSGSAPSALFSASAFLAGAPANVFGIAGLAQPALVGYAVNVRPAVRVVDVAGSPVPAQMVTFQVTGGGGSITGATAVTNAAGNAQVGSWTVGASPATNTLTATVTGSGISGNPVSFTANGVNSTFNITLQNYGPAPAPEAQAAFDSAIAKWQRIIIGDLPNITIQSPGFAAGTCGPGTAAIPTGQNIDDVLIMWSIDSIDGPGKILGQAGPCLVRNGPSNLTVVGVMQFDSADIRMLITGGTLNSVILHEMGHVLGFGSLWSSSSSFPFNCLQNPSSGGPTVDTYYSCPSARAAFDSIGGTSYTGGNKVPLENCFGITGCGAGTYNSHWRESTFYNELMTGYLNSGVGVTNPLSVLTIAAMQDFGYTVNFAAADAYARTFMSPPALAAAASVQRIELGDDIYKGPLFAVDQAGRVTAIIRH
jgi:hypothetical protein